MWFQECHLPMRLHAAGLTARLGSAEAPPVYGHARQAIWLTEHYDSMDMLASKRAPIPAAAAAVCMREMENISTRDIRVLHANFRGSHILRN